MNKVSDWDVAMGIPDMEKHIGDWVLVANHKIVLVTKDRKKISSEIKEHPRRDYYLIRILDPNITYIYEVI